jgi:hypothetical protein
MAKEPEDEGFVGERAGSKAYICEHVLMKFENTFLISAPVKPVKPSLASVATINLAWPR